MNAANEVDTGERIVLRFGELWLKGGNRDAFERQLARNVRTALGGIEGAEVVRRTDHLLVTAGARPAEAARRLQDVFGISSLSPAIRVAPALAAILAAAPAVVERALERLPAERRIAYRVSSKRAEKRFPYTSPELDRLVGDAVMVRFPDRLRVDLDEPELVLGVHVRTEEAYLFAERLPGACGLPVGSTGRVLCLISGGIDSPVAAWLAMKRGAEVAFITFHAPPWVGDSFVAKVERLVRALARYQNKSRLCVVRFTPVQEAIREQAPEKYRTVLYRRFMQRIASELAWRGNLKALVTGDSLGQVASQTLENLACIRAASDTLLLQPLIGFDKTETIALAKRIGTFDISIQPEADCCTVFQPRRPVIFGRRDACEAAEGGLDVAGLVSAAVAGAEWRALD